MSILSLAEGDISRYLWYGVTFVFFILILVIAMIVLLRMYISTPPGRLQLDQISLKAPIIGKLLQKVAIARFSRTLALLLRAGVPVLQALDIVAESTGNEVLARAAQDVKANVRSGESMSAPLDKHSVFPPMAVQMIAVENLMLLWPDLDRLADADNPDVAHHAREAVHRLFEEMEWEMRNVG